MDWDSMCSMSLTAVVMARSVTVSTRFSMSFGDRPVNDQMTVITGMFTSGKMSTGMRAIVTTPSTRMSNATTTNVYGRRSASRTIHMRLTCQHYPAEGAVFNQMAQCFGRIFQLVRLLDDGLRRSRGEQRQNRGPCRRFDRVRLCGEAVSADPARPEHRDLHAMTLPVSWRRRRSLHRGGTRCRRRRGSPSVVRWSCAGREQ